MLQGCFLVPMFHVCALWSSFWPLPLWGSVSWLCSPVSWQALSSAPDFPSCPSAAPIWGPARCPLLPGIPRPTAQPLLFPPPLGLHPMAHDWSLLVCLEQLSRPHTLDAREGSTGKVQSRLWPGAVLSEQSHPRAGIPCIPHLCPLCLFRPLPAFSTLLSLYQGSHLASLLIQTLQSQSPTQSPNHFGGSGQHSHSQKPWNHSVRVGTAPGPLHLSLIHKTSALLCPHSRACNPPTTPWKRPRCHLGTSLPPASVSLGVL